MSVGINPPRSVRPATDILWFLYHDQVSVYVDGDGDWSVVFETRCRHLQGDLLCRIYAERPVICREFDNASCDVNTEGGRTFTTPDEFLSYLERERPRVFRKLSERYLPPDLRERLARRA